MARRRFLSDEQLAPFWAWASDERAIVRHYTLSRADLDLIAKKRKASNQLGFAVLILWNTKYLEVAYAELRRQGGTINDDLLRHVAPLGWKHIGLTGDYV